MKFSFALTLLVASSNAIQMDLGDGACVKAAAPATGCVVEGSATACDCPKLFAEPPKCEECKDGAKDCKCPAPKLSQDAP